MICRGVNFQQQKKLLRFSYISQERVARWDRAWNRKEPEPDRENPDPVRPGNRKEPEPLRTDPLHPCEDLGDEIVRCFAYQILVGLKYIHSAKVAYGGQAFVYESFEKS